jgi:hypothetical protein
LKKRFAECNAQTTAQVIASAKAVAPKPLFLQGEATYVAAMRAAIQAKCEMLGAVSGLLNNVANDQRHDLMAVTLDDFDWRGSLSTKTGSSPWQKAPLVCVWGGKIGPRWAALGRAGPRWAARSANGYGPRTGG